MASPLDEKVIDLLIIGGVHVILMIILSEAAAILYQIVITRLDKNQIGWHFFIAKCVLICYLL